MRSHLPTRKNPLAAATSAAGARDDVGDPTLYVTLNAVRERRGDEKETRCELK